MTQQYTLIQDLEILDNLTNNSTDYQKQKNKIINRIHNKTFDPYELDDDSTPLMISIGLEQPEIAIALVQSGLSRPEYVSIIHNQTALILACAYNLHDVAIEILKTGKSNPSHINNDSETALLLSCNKELEDVAIEIINTGESMPDHVNLDGNTALIFACTNNLQDLAFALIRTGNSNPQQVNNDTNTVLMYCCINRLSNIAIEIIKTGNSNPEHVNIHGYTALMLACNFNLSDVAITLINTHKSNPQQVTKDGNSALYIAEQNNMTEIVDLLIPLLKENFFIDVSSEGFDIVNQKQSIVSQYLDNYVNNIVFKIDDKIWLLSKDQLIRQIKDENNLKYACFEAGDNDYDNGINYSDDSNIDMSNLYFALSSLLPLRIAIKKRDIDYIINSPYSSKLYVLTKTDSTLPSIISKSYRDGASGVGSDYCQPGKSLDVYKLNRAEAHCKTIVTNKLEEKVIQQKEEKTINILYKAMPYKFDINENTTIGDLKMTLLNKLVELNKIPDTNQNVKFIFNGKIYTDDSILLTSISTNPFEITLQSMVNPKIGGKKLLSKRKQTNKFKKSKKLYKKNTRKYKNKNNKKSKKNYSL